MAQPDWTQLPKELIDAIAQRLDYPWEVYRFRSVCTTWRSSVTHTPLRLPNLFKVISNEETDDWGFYLSKRAIYRVALPGDRLYAGQPISWIVKIEEDTPNKKHLLNPLSDYLFYPLPESFSKLFDPLKFRVSKITEETVLQYITDQKFTNSNRVNDERSLYMEKVVMLPNNLGNQIGFVLLTIHVSGKLAIMRSGEERWTVIHDYYISPYDDVNVLEGKFYAVDYTGRMVHVDAFGNVCLVASSVFGGDKKFLVESNGVLLLVDQYLKIDVSRRRDDDDDDEYGPQFINERIVHFKVFRLNVEWHQWVEIDSLGDRLLFLGDNSTFSASASDFGNGCKGNCIYFMDTEYCSQGAADGSFMNFGMGVYHMQLGLMGSALNIPGCAQLFWPPPNWTSTMMQQARNNFRNLSIGGSSSSS